jgi:hypothetical protein
MRPFFRQNEETSLTASTSPPSSIKKALGYFGLFNTLSLVSTSNISRK